MARNPIERKFGQWDAKESEMASDVKCVTRYHRRKIFKDAISSGLSHWELEGKNWLRSDERKARNLGKKKAHLC